MQSQNSRFIKYKCLSDYLFLFGAFNLFTEYHIDQNALSCMHENQII